MLSPRPHLIPARPHSPELPPSTPALRHAVSSAVRRDPRPGRREPCGVPFLLPVGEFVCRGAISGATGHDGAGACGATCRGDTMWCGGLGGGRSGGVVGAGGGVVRCRFRRVCLFNSHLRRRSRTPRTLEVTGQPVAGPIHSRGSRDLQAFLRPDSPPCTTPHPPAVSPAPVLTTTK